MLRNLRIRYKLQKITEQLVELLNIAKHSSFLSYRIDPKKLRESEFKQLSLLNKNKLY